MRKIVILSLAVIMLLVTISVTSCHTPREVTSNSSVTDSTDLNTSQSERPDSVAGTIRRSGNQLLWQGEEIRLRAVNFDNLTWFAEPELDGVPVYLYHHTQEDYDTVKELGFNSVRFFLRWQDLYEDESCTTRKEAGWDWLSGNIRWAGEREIFLIIDFHCPFGGFGTQGDSTWPIWTDTSTRDAYFRAWEDIATACAGETYVAGYDLMNEPCVPEDGVIHYQELMEETIRIIRAEDPDHLLIVEAITGIEGDPESYSRPTWVEFDDPNLMYSFHFYEPIPFTHNEAAADKGITYPDASFGTDELRGSLDAMIAPPFLSEYPVLLGEFGCTDWRDGSGSDQWISDVYRWCEDRGVHTGLFAYRSFSDINADDDFGFGIFHMLTGGEGENSLVQKENRALIDVLL